MLDVQLVIEARTGRCFRVILKINSCNIITPVRP